MAHNGRPRRGIGSGDIDMAGISTKLDSAVRGNPRNDNTSLISGGIQSSLFTFDRSERARHDDDLDAALRSRGHPGLRFGLNKSQSTSRVPVVKAATAPATAETGVLGEDGLPTTGDELSNFSGGQARNRRSRCCF